MPTLKPRCKPSISLVFSVVLGVVEVVNVISFWSFFISKGS